jgi:tryptophan-rich sensory protein
MSTTDIIWAVVHVAIGIGAMMGCWNNMKDHERNRRWISAVFWLFAAISVGLFALENLNDLIEHFTK